MDYKTRAICIAEVANYKDRDAFVSDMAMSSVWADDNAPADRVVELGCLYDAAHRGVRDIANLAGISQRKLAERFCIPYRTMENWASGSREAPVYVLLMMQEVLGLIR